MDDSIAEFEVFSLVLQSHLAANGGIETCVILYGAVRFVVVVALVVNIVLLAD